MRNLEAVGIKACGINGKDGHTLVAKKLLDDKGRDLGFVGEIESVDTTLINTLIEAGFAEKLVFLTDVEGILKDKDDPSSKITRMNAGEAKRLIAEGIIKGGMIPKVECCLDALEKGVQTVHVLDGRLPHSILLEIFTAEGIGTMMLPEEKK